MRLTFCVNCFKCRELQRSVYDRPEKWRYYTTVEAKKAISLPNHFDTIYVPLLSDEVMLGLHLCLDCVEWMTDDGIGAPKQETAYH